MEGIVALMSSLTRSEEMRSHYSVHASSQHAVGAILENTASSTRDKGYVFGTLATQSFAAPNSAFL